MHRNASSCLILLLIAIVLHVPMTGRSAELDAVQRVKVLLRVLTYDRSLEGRLDGDNVVVKVLYDAGSDKSKAEKDEVVKALQSVAGIKIKGHTLKVSELSFTSDADLKSKLSGGKTAAVYVCGGLEGKLSGISAETRNAKVASLCGSQKMAEGGISVAAIEEAGSGKIIVNLAATKAEGMQLESSVLRLAEVIR